MKLAAKSTLIVAIAFCLITSHLRGDDAAKPNDLRTSLIGTWRMTSMKINGQKNDIPDNSVTYKHVTPAGFTWLSHEKETGKIFRAAGGTYTLVGDSYIEKVEYGFGADFEGIKNAKHPFTCKIEGDTWYHNGKLAGGTTIEEEWVRVKPSDAAKP